MLSHNYNLIPPMMVYLILWTPLFPELLVISWVLPNFPSLSMENDLMIQQMEGQFSRLITYEQFYETDAWELRKHIISSGLLSRSGPKFTLIHQGLDLDFLRVCFCLFVCLFPTKFEFLTYLFFHVVCPQLFTGKKVIPFYASIPNLI